MDAIEGLHMFAGHLLMSFNSVYFFIIIIIILRSWMIVLIYYFDLLHNCHTSKHVIS